MKHFLTLTLVLILTALPAWAQSPQAEILQQPISGAAVVQPSGTPEADAEPQATEIAIHPLDTMQSSVARQLALLRSLGEIHMLLAQLRQGPELLMLLDEELEPKERLHLALSAAPEPTPADSAVSEIDALREEIAALKLLIENAALPQYEIVPAPEPAEPAQPAEPGQWQLARDNVQYIQLPDRETSGRVALVAGGARAEVGVRETIEIDGKTITLREIQALSDGGVRLSFLSDGKPATFRY